MTFSSAAYVPRREDVAVCVGWPEAVRLVAGPKARKAPAKTVRPSRQRSEDVGSRVSLVGLAFDSLYALAGTALGRPLCRSVSARRTQQWVLRSLLIGFGARLALVIALEFVGTRPR